MHGFGGPEVLAVEEIPRPSPAAGEVLIRVRAASVNPVDFKIRSGEIRPAGFHLPATPGRDVSGVVEAIGPGVSGLAVGDPVYALLDRDHGGYAEFAVARSDAVAAKPKTIDHIRAAGVPLAATTAWQGLFDHGRLQAGERVLIHGAAGGVGHFAVQFAKDRGAYVIATAHIEDHELLRTLGADEVIDYRTERFEGRARDIDLVFDLVAGETQERSWNVLRDGGRLVSTLRPPSAEAAERHHGRGEVFEAQPDGRELAAITKLIEDGKVSVFVQRILPLGEAARAQQQLEGAHIRGKIVLTVDEEATADAW